MNDPERILDLANAPALAGQAPCADLLKLMGIAANHLGRPKDAVDPLMRALSLQLDDKDAYLELGIALTALQLYAEAAECFRTVSIFYPEHLGAQAYLIHLEQRACRWEGHDERCRELFTAQQAAGDAGGKHYSPPFVLVALSHHPAQMLEAARG